MARSAVQHDWIVEQEPDGPDVEVEKLVCPRCFNELWVKKGTWPGNSAMYGRPGKTGRQFSHRSCPFCFCTSMIPKVVVVRTQDDDLVIPYETALALEGFGLIAYKLDAPAGPIYEPAPGVSLDKVRRSIVWDSDGE